MLRNGVTLAVAWTTINRMMNRNLDWHRFNDLNRFPCKSVACAISAAPMVTVSLPPIPPLVVRDRGMGSRLEKGQNTTAVGAADLGQRRLGLHDVMQGRLVHTHIRVTAQYILKPSQRRFVVT